MEIYAQVTNDGTAMAETALCKHHLVTHKAHMEVDHDYEGADKDGPRVELTDTTFHLCGNHEGGNEALACNVCGADIYTPDLVGKTVKSIEYGTVTGNWGDEPATTLKFTDGTVHTFVHAQEGDD